jgi:hypothetical protein
LKHLKGNALSMVSGPSKVTFGATTPPPQVARRAAEALAPFNNVQTSQLVLPGLILGNMAYKMGSEKNPEKRSELLTNSLVSWAGGAAMATMHINKVLPYYLLPAIASTIMLYQMGQKDTPKEKRDTLVNHATWWFSGIGAQALARAVNLKGPFQGICAFAAGASMAGPIISHIIQEKVLPLFDKNKPQQPALNSFSTEYRVGATPAPNFSPFSGATNSATQLANNSLKAKATNNPYNALDPYNLNALIPGTFFK